MTTGQQTQYPLHAVMPQVMEAVPRPPYAVTLQNYFLVGVAFEAAAIRHLVPDELDLPPLVNGLIGAGHAPTGWGAAPFSNLYLALSVEGLPSPDGTPAMFRPLNIYSKKAADLFRQSLYAGVREGDFHFEVQDDLMRADITAEGGVKIRIRLRKRPGEGLINIAGIHHYLGQNTMGEVTSVHTGYNGDYAPADVQELAFEGLQPAWPPGAMQVTWGGFFDRMPVSIGAPRGSPFAALVGAPGAATLTTLLSRIGIAAACVDPAGDILSTNADARRLFRQAGLGAGARLRLPARPGQGGMLALPRDEIGLPVIAQILPLDAALLGRTALLVLLRDPAAPGGGDPAAVLELLGLTPAEARLAAAVGQGSGLADAAARLGITVSTARSQLKIVFDKLGVGRQAELSRIVATIRPGQD